jgi:hypothetical protein
MPYIDQDLRSILDRHVDGLAEQIDTVGELNYAVTRLVLGLIKKVGLNYNSLSLIMGTLYLIPLEIYRRIGVPYEDRKIKANGDIREVIQFNGGVCE